MKSIWNERGPADKRDKRKLPAKAEAAVIGGGMAGILCGWLLQEAGVEVIVLEADAVGSGQTGKTTAKITSQHGLIYDRLTESMGEEAAGQYGRANQAAIDEYERIIKKKKIDCSFIRIPAYLYTGTDEGACRLERERTAAVKAGIPASIVYETDLPFPVKMALKFENQAQFSPLDFLYGLAEELTVYEYTRVRKVKGHEIITSRGAITADKIIFATHFPLPNWPGFYFAKMYQERSYVLAVKVSEAGKDSRDEKTVLNGMYYGIDTEGLSFRSTDSTVLLGGMGHRTGECRSGNSYINLRKKAGELWGKYEERAAWAAQDCMTLDSVPYIGTFSRLTPDWYVASGFGKWGMTSSMVAAMAIRDAITGRYNSDWKVFSPQRRTIKASWKNFLGHMGHTMKNFFVPGGPRCTHLGCRLRWNRTEKTWDCPCHGSRFEKAGNLIDNPAKKNMKKSGPRSSL